MNKINSVAGRQTGFTLIEIMVVVVIIGILSTLIVPNLLKNSDKAMAISAKADIRTISAQMAMYKLDNFAYPSTSEGVQALVSNPGGKKNWSGYLEKKPMDPWDNEYQYLQPVAKEPNYIRFMEFWFRWGHRVEKVPPRISATGMTNS